MALDRATGLSLHALGIVLTVAALGALVWQFAAVYLFATWSEPAELTSSEVIRYWCISGIALAIAAGSLVLSFLRRSIAFGVVHTVLLIVVVLSIFLFAVPRAG